MDTNDFVIGKIKEYREKHGYNQERMASELGISFSSLWRYENKEKAIPLDVAERLAHLFGTTLPRLIKEMEEPISAEEQKKRDFLDDVWDAHIKCFPRGK